MRKMIKLMAIVLKELTRKLTYEEQAEYEAYKRGEIEL